MNTPLIVALALTAASCQQLTKVRECNEAVAAGQVAYAQGDAGQAAQDFEAALAAKARRIPDPRLVLNLAHAQARAGQSGAAQGTYARALTSSPANIGSVARQQLAVLAARQGQVAQALNLLKQALILNPANTGARYDYEVLSDYLARQQAPDMPPPGGGSGAEQQPKNPDKKSEAAKSPSKRVGDDGAGELPQPNQPPGPPTKNSESKPNPTGEADPQRPTPTPGTTAKGGRNAGSGERQPVASGSVPGRQRGLDLNGRAGPAAPTGIGRQPGSEAALPEDVRLQTQRERLRAMNLSPAQARQVLEALRAQEQQYLQQLARPATAKPDPDLVTSICQAAHGKASRKQ
jgi:tetratricopeptide (TPR) repeat protein